MTRPQAPLRRLLHIAQSPPPRMFTQVRSSSRRVSPETVGQRALMRAVYVVLEPQYQNEIGRAHV